MLLLGIKHVLKYVYRFRFVKFSNFKYKINRIKFKLRKYIFVIKKRKKNCISKLKLMVLLGNEIQKTILEKKTLNCSY